MARGLAALALATSLGLVAPGAPTATPDEDGLANAPAPIAPTVDPTRRLHASIKAALEAHVPGASGRDWELHELVRSDAPSGSAQYIVATGVVATPGSQDTQVRLTGRYHAGSGELDRVSYRLQASDPVPQGNPTGWNVQRAVNYAFSQVLPDDQVAFALESARSSRVEGGGRRFEGDGIGTWGEGDARFVSFSMMLSARGELVEFDYSTLPEPPTGQGLPFVAEN